MKIKYQLMIMAGLLALGAGGWLLATTMAASPSGAGHGRPGGMALPVDVHLAQPGHLLETLETVGTARARNAVEIAPVRSGRLVALHFEEGQQVEKGELLAELDSSREQAELREAQAQLKDLRARLRRFESLGAGQHVSRAEIDSLRASVQAAKAREDLIKARLEELHIKAPFAGIVGLSEFSPGAMVTPQSRLTTLDDVASIELEFSVPERYLARLEQGAVITARSAAYPNRVFEGRLRRLNTRIDPSTRSIRVQAELPNPDGLLRPGMFLAVELTIAERANALLVPEESIIIQGTQRHVFVVIDGKAERVEVVTGVRRNGMVEVIRGISAGAMVVTGGANRLRGGMPVKVRNPAGSPAADKEVSAAS